MDDRDARYTRITFRMPKDLHARLQADADAKSRSMNAEIIEILEISMRERDNQSESLSSILEENLALHRALANGLCLALTTYFSIQLKGKEVPKELVNNIKMMVRTILNFNAEKIEGDLRYRGLDTFYPPEIREFLSEVAAKPLTAHPATSDIDIALFDKKDT